METLRQLAQDGHTVICSIHQPRGSVYYKFDDIVLLTEGALIYAGPARDEPLAYFSKFGFVVKPIWLSIMQNIPKLFLSTEIVFFRTFEF